MRRGRPAGLKQENFHVPPPGGGRQGDPPRQ